MERALAWLEAMPACERRLRLEVCKLWRRKPEHLTEGDLRRRIVLSPFGGAYSIAGYVLAIEGSPPPFLAVLAGHDLRWATLHVLSKPSTRPVEPPSPGPYAPRRLWEGLRAAAVEYVNWHAKAELEAVVNGAEQWLINHSSGGQIR